MTEPGYDLDPSNALGLTGIKRDVQCAARQNCVIDLQIAKQLDSQDMTQLGCGLDLSKTLGMQVSDVQ